MKYLICAVLSFIVFNSHAILPDPSNLANDSLNIHRAKLQLATFVNEQPDYSYQEQAQIAMSCYPELRGTEIEFVRKDLKTTMASRPTIGFIFTKKGKRKYRIFIDTGVKNEEGLLLSDVPFDAQVGVIGHELAHIVDYKEKTALGIVFTGVGYLFHPFRRNLEHKVDEITIAHGLGVQLHKFSEYVLKEPKVSEKYKKYKRKIYYKPQQLSTLMSQYSIY